ncbi:uncharacterized protein N7496_004604 [Penicillium cataractarum]|uniref:Threonine/serine exporter-like N-terminal domain-containing protein n=1 Tax=Penicillium cataractarum TaxID=2100454 RepID=A0A9W9SF00_9EURO|nr:uncharacterized protein N7496_004604 [Penicillium cataractarum]KAJ5377195.1 hypothetical protein N7496_004604 [Penicillium cataractarum]
MAGGYFDLPVSRRSHTSDAMAASTKTSSSSQRCPLPAYSEAVSPAGPQSLPERSNDVGAQGRYRNAGILHSTNRVQFTLADPEPKEPTGGGATAKCRLDRRGSSQLPQRPAPTANIPFIQEKKTLDSLWRPSVEDKPAGASAYVTGLAISSETSSTIIGNNEISRGAKGSTADKGRAICYARKRAQRLASLLGRYQKSPKPDPRTNLVTSIAPTPTEKVISSKEDNELSMISIAEKHQLFDDFAAATITLTDEEEADDIDGRSTTRTAEAQYIVRQMSRRDFSSFITGVQAPSPGPLSGQVTPSEGRRSESFLERPKHYRNGILSSILKLYDQQYSGYHHHNYPNSPYGRGRYEHSRQGSVSDDCSGRGYSPDPVWKPHRPRKWYEKSPSQSSTSLTGSLKNVSPISMLRRSRSSGAVAGASGIRRWAKHKLEDEIRITVHIAELLSRQRYLIRLCRALMKYGAPTHRLEEYMRMTARVLEIDGQFLYIPGCMIISFDDTSTHTTEVRVVRSNQGIDLGKLADVHEIYKEVIHDVIGVEEAIQRLDETMKRHNKFHILFLIFAHGCASASVGPFAFNARPIDMPIAFLLGCLLGVLQLILYPKSSLYSNVFEISAAVLTSFLARAFGSIRYQGEPLFCFSALAQAAIALILPGYTVLCASLELQSRSIVAGSVRMVYAIIYSLFLGFGITIGTAVYGLLDSQASADYTCPASPINNEYLQRFPFVLLFTACLAIVNHAKWKQIPVMMIISLAGYVVSYFSSKRFDSNTQVSNALGAFVIGVMGNVYSRVRHGLAAAAMLPAIFVLVPSGLAASGSLISGITSAEEMTRSPYGVVANGTQGFVDAAKNLSAAEARNQSYGVVFDIGYGMVQVAIGTTVGLFLAALVVYPLGKKRSGLFSF